MKRRAVGWLWSGSKRPTSNLAAKLPHHRQDRRQLEQVMFSHGPFATKPDQVGDDDLVTGTWEIGRNSVSPSTTPKMIA